MIQNRAKQIIIIDYSRVPKHEFKYVLHGTEVTELFTAL